MGPAHTQEAEIMKGMHTQRQASPSRSSVTISAQPEGTSRQGTRSHLNNEEPHLLCKFLVLTCQAHDQKDPETLRGEWRQQEILPVCRHCSFFLSVASYTGTRRAR